MKEIILGLIAIFFTIISLYDVFYLFEDKNEDIVTEKATFTDKFIGPAIFLTALALLVFLIFYRDEPEIAFGYLFSIFK